MVVVAMKETTLLIAVYNIIGRIEVEDDFFGRGVVRRDEGFDEIADWFETLAKAERSHANRFQKALDNLDA